MTEKILGRFESTHDPEQYNAPLQAGEAVDFIRKARRAHARGGGTLHPMYRSLDYPAVQDTAEYRRSHRHPKK